MIVVTLFVAIWDWFTTTVGAITLFAATEIFQLIFCGIVGLMFSMVILMTPNVFRTEHIAQRILLFPSWFAIAFVSLFTTFKGNVAVAKYSNPWRATADLGQLVAGLDAEKIALVSLTTLFVFCSVVALAYLLDDG